MVNRKLILPDSDMRKSIDEAQQTDVHGKQAVR